MTFQDWLARRILQPHRTSRDEITSLVSLIDRDLKVSRTPGLDPDRRYNIAYNAALQAATLALATSGYRASRQGQHYHTLQSLVLTVGTDEQLVLRLDVARRKRNQDV